MSLSLFVIVLSLLAPALAAQVNTTVAAGTGSPILFSGSGWTDGQVWADYPPCGWSTDTNGDSATFTFLGSALYVLGDKPSTDRFSDIVGTLDGQSVPLIAGEGGYCNEWAYAIEGLQEGLHTFVVTVQDNTLSNPPTFFSLISMTYTWTEPDATSSPGSTSSTTTESSTTVSSSTSESSTLTSTSSSSSDTSTSTTSSTPSTSSAPETTETSTSTSSSSTSSSASSTSESVTTTSSSSSSPTSTSSSAPASTTSSTSTSSSSSSSTSTSTTPIPTSEPVTTSSSTPASSSSPATSSTPQTTETPTSTSSVPSTSSTSVAAPSVTFTFSSSGPSTPPTQTTSAVTSPTTSPTSSPTRTLIVSTTRSSSSGAVTTPSTISSSPTEATSEQPTETSTSSTAPDPTVVVGVSSVVPSNTASSSSSSSQQTSLAVSPTIQPTPTPSSNNSTSAADHSLNGHNRTAVIAGSTVGGFTAAAILLAATYAATHPGWLEYVLIAISNALGIGAGYTVRRLIIKKHGALKLSDTKIALFITTGKSDAFALDDSVIVWQINNVNDQNDFFTVDIPCTKRLKTRLYFGTYVHADHSDRINVEHFGEAPATLEEEHGHIRWDPAVVASGRAAARNMRQLPTSIVLGTGSTPADKKEETAPSMIPFLRIPDGDFKPGDTYEVQGKLYLRAFRVKSDCQAGQPGSAIPNPLEVVADELTKPNSIAIDELAPLTTWNITGKKNGGLSLNITTTKKTDKKQYKHECVVDKKARREAHVGGDEEDLV